MNSNEIKTNNVCIVANANIAKFDFNTFFGTMQGKIFAGFKWVNHNEASAKDIINELLKELKIDFPKDIPLDFKINDLCILYAEENSTFKFLMNIGNKSNEDIAKLSIYKTKSNNSKNEYGAKLKLLQPIRFSSIPIIGNLLGNDDCISNIEVNLMSVPENDKYVFKYGISMNLKILSFVMNNITIGNISDMKKLPVVGLITKDNLHKNNNEVVIDNEKGEIVDSSNDIPDDANGVKWIDIKKNLGFFIFKRFGFKLDDVKKDNKIEKYIFLYLDIDMSFSILKVNLAGLHIGIPISIISDFSLEKFKEMSFGIDGLAVDFNKPPITIKGALLRVNDTRYDGALTVKVSDFCLTAIGSYSKVNNKPSLFAFLYVGFPIGPTPAFFIKGLAAGFGFNRGLKLPDIKSVRSFPLVSMVLDDNATSSDDSSIMNVMTGLQKYIYESEGQYFITAGIKFTSFEILECFALVSVLFGKELEVSLLGIGRISLPSKAKKPFVFLELALKTVFVPTKGFFGMEASLTSASYILCDKCKIEGGFAFYLWYSGENAGDFVVSIGGYHPQFNKPKHYPSVDRLAIRWQISNNISMEGEGYFAITPACMMLGASMAFIYSAGWINAWFRARFDAFLQWSPFYYDLEVSVSMGVSFTIKIFFVKKTISLEIGARMHLWGPEFSGEIHVKLALISFTISIGSKNTVPFPISYNEFKDKYLKDSVSTRISNGLIKEEKRINGEKVSLLSAKNMEITFISKMPITKVNQYNKDDYGQFCTNVGVLPMGANKKLTNECSVYLYRKNSKGIYEEVSDTLKKALKIELVSENVPRALWGLEKVGESVIKNVIGQIKLSVMLQDDISKSDETKYKLSDLTENELIVKYFSNKKEKKYFIKDYYDEDLYSIIEKKTMKRPKEYIVRDIQKRKKENISFLKNNLYVELWDCNELNDSELLYDSKEHFMVQPVKRGIEKNE